MDSSFSGEDRFTPRQLRLFYLFLAGIILVSVSLLYGLVLLGRGGEEPEAARLLMLRSWWMVPVGVVTFSAAYMIVAFVSALGRGFPQPLKPGGRAVALVAVAFGFIHSFRLALGGNLPSDFVAIFLKDILGIFLALAVTSIGVFREGFYREGG